MAGALADRLPLAPARARRELLAVAAVALAGVVAFINMYSTQPLLPLFEQLFHASKAAVGMTVSAATLGVALSAPLWGLLAGRIGRRTVIVGASFLLALPTLGAASAGSLSALIAWRFAQGLVMPGVFGVTIAHITEQWEGARLPKVMSIYVSGTVLGGFAGRAITGFAATHAWLPGLPASWRSGFVAVAALDLLLACVMLRGLPGDRPAAGGAAPTGRRLLRAMAAPPLLATFAVGFTVLFSLVATFTYVTFHLARPPFALTTAQLSELFAVYLVGLFVTPVGGSWIHRLGPRRALLGAVSVALVGVALTLIPWLPAVLLGLILLSSGVFVCQSASTTHLQRAAPDGGRTLAAGLYVTCYYVGGTVAGVLPGHLWSWGDWPACVALVMLVQGFTLLIAGLVWREQPRLAAGATVVEAP